MSGLASDLGRDSGSGDDQVHPFLLESSGIRGRLLRLGPLADKILARHDYPPALARLLAEMLALAGALSSLMKYEGVFTLQTKGDGPVNLMVADVTGDGGLRGYAAYDGERLAALLSDQPDPSFHALVGEGYFAFTVDGGPGMDRYQGIVELQGKSLADCLQHYFLQSDQVQSGILLTSSINESGVRSGALILQRLPEEGGVADLPSGLSPDEEEAWRRAMILQVTCSDRELLDPELAPHQLLFNLFHEERVRAFEPRPLIDRCRCSRAKIEQALSTIEPEELMALLVDDRFEVTCEFCNSAYPFDRAALENIAAKGTAGNA